MLYKHVDEDECVSFMPNDIVKEDGEADKDVMFDMAKEYKFSAIVNYKDDTYFIDSCDTHDHGYELMIFWVACYFPNQSEKFKDGNYKGKTFLTDEIMHAVDFEDLYVKRYQTVEAAEKDFDYIINNFEEFYKNDMSKDAC